MPIKVTNDKGEEVEALTPDEVDEEVEKRVQEKTDEVKKQVEEEFTAKLEEKDQEIAKIKETIDEAAKGPDGDKSANAALRAKLQEAEKARDAMKEEFQTEVRTLRETLTKGQVDDLVTAVAGQDQDLKDKVIHHFNRLSDKADTKEEMVNKVKDAYLLATGSSAPSPVNAAIASGVPGQAPGAPQTVSTDVKELGKSRFGLTDEDFDKFQQK